MKEQLTIITRKGQITLPVEIRRALGLEVGQKVAVSIDDAEPQHATLRPVRSVAELTFGAVTPRRRPEDMGQLREQAIEDIAENAAMEGMTLTTESM